MQPSFWSGFLCKPLQEFSFPRPLLYPLLWDLVTQSLPAQGLQSRAMTGCCPGPQVPAALAGAGLKHCITAPGSQAHCPRGQRKDWWLHLAGFGQGCHPAQLAGTKHCSALAPAWHPAQWPVGSCPGAHDHRALTQDAARPTEKST